MKLQNQYVMIQVSFNKNNYEDDVVTERTTFNKWRRQELKFELDE